MPLPADDEAFLNNKGYTFEYLAEGGAELLLVLRGVVLADGRYDQARTDVLVKIPPGYPVAQLDMFWVCPALRFASGGTPEATESHETHEGRDWQRFSRHLPPNSWRPGTDSIRTFLPRVLQELTQP